MIHLVRVRVLRGTPPEVLRREFHPFVIRLDSVPAIRQSSAATLQPRILCKTLRSHVCVCVCYLSLLYRNPAADGTQADLLITRFGQILDLDWPKWSPAPRPNRFSATFRANPHIVPLFLSLFNCQIRTSRHKNTHHPGLHLSVRHSAEHYSCQTPCGKTN